jgi:hypothetical protein
MTERVSLIANSQGTSRGIAYGESYPALFMAAVPDLTVQILAMSAWSFQDVVVHFENVLLFRPRIAIVQLGIIECTRRILSEREKAFFLLLPGGRRATFALHHRRMQVIRLRRRLHIDTRVSTPVDFRSHVGRVLDKFSKGDIEPMLLEIPPFSPAYEERYYPFINEDVELFNEVLREFGAVPFLDDRDVAGPIYQEGTVHFNVEGHRLVADRLVDLIRGRLAPARESVGSTIP